MQTSTAYKTGKFYMIPLVVVTAVLFFSPITDVRLFAEGQKTAAPAYGDAIVVASTSDARTLVPILASDSASSDVCSMIFNGLTKYDKDINLVGDLAESWEVLDGGLEIIFKLRKNVKWHDGYPFTARDVEFTYKKIIDPSVKTPYSANFNGVESVTVVDDYTVKVRYKKVFSPALERWGMWIMPEHILKNEDVNNSSFSRHPVGTGPYIFKSWKTAEKIELVSNRDYFEGRPYIDRYVLRIIPDDATVFLELQTEGVDMALLTPLQFTKQTDNRFFGEHYNKFRYPSFGYTYMGYNLRDPKFADVRVRRAIDCAVNKEALIDTVLFGLAKVTTGPFMLDSWAYNKDVLPASYDPKKAKALLGQSGWLKLNREGWLEKDGKIFEFTVFVNAGNNDRLRCAEIIQKYLKDVGIKMKIRTLEWGVLLNEYINKRRFEAVLMGWFLSRDPDNYDIWHSSKTREGEFNFIGYNNPEVDGLLEKGRGTFDQAERARIYHDIHRLIHEDEPCLFLYSSDILPIVNKRFRNVEPSAIGIGYNFIKWFVPEKEQRYAAAGQGTK